MDSKQQINATFANFLIIAMLWLCCCVESLMKTDPVSIGCECNTGTYVTGDPFAKSLDYVLSDLENATADYRGYDYRSISPYSYAFAYGHATCSRNLTSSDCTTCLESAKTPLLSSCPNSVGVNCQLTDCSMRYEQYPFSD